MSAIIWVVDDDESLRWVLARALARQQWQVETFSCAADVLEALDLGDLPLPDVLISDVRMPGEHGLSLLSTLKTNHPTLPVIITTAYSDLETTVKAFANGAFEYLTKPVDLPQLIDLVTRALPVTASEVNAAPQADGVSVIKLKDGVPMSGLVGQAATIQEVYRMIGRLSSTLATVLLTGESGTGKELVARALHQHSQCALGPFVAINTAAIPADLLESELFGHEKGAFTGAQQQRIGRFEQAAGGTLFLDEIGDMPYALQTRLLRVLSDGTFYRVGGQHPIRTNVRLIAATHQDLAQLVIEKKFREDLLYRLNVIRIHLPALRDRRDDIPLLIEHFLQQLSATLHIPLKICSPAALAKIMTYRFPGNVRELENLCRWLMIMTVSQVIDVGDLPEDIRLTNDLQTVVNVDDVHATTAHAELLPQGLSWQQGLAQHVTQSLVAGEVNIYARLLDQFEQIVFESGLACFDGRRGETAQALGVGRNTLTRKLDKRA